MRRGTFRSLFSLTSLLLLVGCSSVSQSAAPTTPSSQPASTSSIVQPEAEPTPKDYVLVEKAIWPRSSTYYDFVVVLSNPNDEFAWDSAYLDIDGLADDGAILDSTWATVSLLPNRSVAIYGSFFTDGRTPVTLEIRGMPAPMFVGASTYCEVSVSRTSVEPSYGDTWVRGYVTSDCPSELEDLSIQALVRDANGKLIFGGQGTVGIVKPGVESFAEVLLWDVEVPPSSEIEIVSELGY